MLTQAPPRAVVETDGASRCVLIVDDEEVILEVLQQGLEFAGFAVRTASSGVEALSALVDGGVDLVVLDVMLGDLDGFEVCRRLRAAENWVPVIFLTARDEDVDLIEAFDVGADDYVTKPFRLSEIVARAELTVATRSANFARSKPTVIPPCTTGPLCNRQQTVRSYWSRNPSTRRTPT